MSRQLNGFTAIQTDDGYKVLFHDATKEIRLSQKDVNDFANKYAMDMLKGNKPEYSEKEELMISLLEIVLIPDNTIH